MPHRLNLTQFNSKHVKMSATITTWYTTKHTKYNLNTSTIIIFFNSKQNVKLIAKTT